MARKVQHIAWLDRVAVAKSEGQKVATMCGEHVYPMTRMKPEIPTCTPCARALLDEYHASRRTRTLYRFSATTGGAA